MTRVVVLGEVAIDRIADGGTIADVRLGGASYAARAAAACGAEVTLAGEIADDAPSSELGQLDSLRIAYTLSEGRTSRQYLMLATGPGRRRQTYPIPGTARPLVPDTRADAYLILASQGLNLAEALDQADRNGAFTLLDGHEDELLLPKWRGALARVGLLFLNWRTAAELAAGDPERVVEVLGRAHLTTVIKQGRGGMTVFRRGERIEIPSVECDLKLKVGAGDTMAGTVTALLAGGADLSQALRRGAKAASLFMQHGLLPFPSALDGFDGPETYVPLGRLRERIYVAAPFFTEAQRLALAVIEGALGAAQLSYCSPRRDIGVLEPDATDEQRADFFRRDVEALGAAPLVVARLDGDDTGTAWEVGYAYARSKPIVALRSDLRTGLNNMLGQSVEVADNLDDLLKRVFRHLAR